MPPRLSRALATGLMLLVAVPLTLIGVTAGSAAPAHAEEETAAEALKGTLRGPGGAPIPDVDITVEQDGEAVGTSTTDAEGAWQVDLSGAGSYAVRLDSDTLPDRLQLRDRGGEVLAEVAVRPGQQRTVIFPLIPAGQAQQAPEGAEPSPSGDTGSATDGGSESEDSGGASTTGRLLQLLAEGLQFGVIIAITAVGLSLVFGTTHLINFAHGELVTIGAVGAFFLSVSPVDLPLALAAVLAMVLGGGVGFAMERGLWRPMRRRGSGLIQMFIISIGVSLLLRHLILVFHGSRRTQYDQYVLQQQWEIGPIAITPRDLTVTVLAVLVLLGVAFMLQRTRIGKATRAVADNRDLAESSGIDVNRVVLVVWIMAGALAALGGVFFGLSQAVYWDMGFRLLLLMFAGVILGGLGSAYGAIVGSLVIGVVAQVSTFWFSAELQNAWALLVLIIVLVVRPSGILGRAERAG